MTLALLILIPLVGGLAAWLIAGRAGGARAVRWTCLAAAVGQLALAATVWAGSASALRASATGGPWLMDLNLPWVPALGMRIHLAVDGLSILLVVLTGVVGVLSVLASWRSVHEKVGFFHFCLMWSLAGITGAFLALDLFLFYFFWEMMLIPLYLLIRIWGHEQRIFAAWKFFLFTQAGGLLLLLGILGLVLRHGLVTGVYTFDYLDLLGTSFGGTDMGPWLMLAFLAAFAVKLPAVPVHTWLPDAHTQAPVAGSVVLAGLVLKLGAYGLIRFLVPLFPQEVAQFDFLGMLLAVVGILYGGLVAFAQRDMKRYVAYTSVSHMGFVLLAVCAWNDLALQGAVVIMIAHALGTGALFILVGMADERVHTRELGDLGGLWAALPRMGGATTFLAVAALGLPGLAGFVGEFLVLLGTWPVAPFFTVLAAGGLLVSVIYALRFVQDIFLGRPGRRHAKEGDMTAREWVMMGVAIAGTVWIGLFPQTVLDTSSPAVTALRQRAEANGARHPESHKPQAQVEKGTGYFSEKVACPQFPSRNAGTAADASTSARQLSAKPQAARRTAGSDPRASASAPPPAPGGAP